MAEAEGIPPTASVASTGFGIRYIGEHCYAMSGLYAADDTSKTVLEFTTGSGYIVGTIQLNGAVDDDNPPGRMSTTLNVFFNDISIGILATGDENVDMIMLATQEVVIPPFTKVETVIDMYASAADRYASVVFTGRVYGAV